MTDKALRFQTLINALKINQLQLSKAIGVKYSQTNAIFNGRGDFSRAYLQKLHAKYPDVNTHWLLHGEGQMLLSMHGEKMGGVVHEPGGGYTEYKNPVPIPEDSVLRRTFGANLSRLAKRWGLQKLELATILVPGVKKPTVTNYFSGKSQVPLSAMIRLEEQTGIGISTWLMSEITEKEFPLEPLNSSRMSAKSQIEEIRKALMDVISKL